MNQSESKQPPSFIGTRAIRYSRRKFEEIKRGICLPSVSRPVVIIHSDDWGRAGCSGPAALSSLKQQGYEIGHDPWDYSGLESSEDIERLGETLATFKDRDGNAACMTAVFVMANADLRKMVSENFSSFRSIPIKDGFPPPWGDKLLPCYRQWIERGVLYPTLHGYTHFNPYMLLEGWHNTGEFGERVRALIRDDIAYLDSLTPEYNFALVARREGREIFLPESLQEEWVEQGLMLFKEAFNPKCISTCAPGYRANDVTINLWGRHGIKAFHTIGSCSYPHDSGMLLIGRNVFFEPALSNHAERAVENAVDEVMRVVGKGHPAVICSHSINYIERYYGKRETSLCALADLLQELLTRLPDLRFVHDGMFIDAWRTHDPRWLRQASPAELMCRLIS